MTDALDRLKYPIGRFNFPEQIDEVTLRDWIDQIKTLPERLRDELAGLDDTKLNLTYRPGGWTIRQVVHHLPDSHMNAYIRFKLALTEDSPVIRPYLEDRWAELPDAKTLPVKISLDLLDSLHARWCKMLDTLTVEDLNKVYVHPQQNKTWKLKEVVGMYAWHGDHHLNHIVQAKGMN